MLFMQVHHARSKSSCSDSDFSGRGLFCHDEKRDIDTLINSLLEIGLDSESLAGSKPKPISRPPPPVIWNPPPPPRPPPTPPPPTKTTTPPPQRRRLVKTSVPACEDTYPSDILDSDCFIARYDVMHDETYDNLLTTSRAILTTGTFIDKLEPVIDQIIITPFLSSLGPVIPAAATDFANQVNTSVADASKNVEKAASVSASLASSLDAAAKNSTASLQAMVLNRLSQYMNRQMNNINSMIRRANKLSSTIGPAGTLASLKASIGGVRGNVDAHSAATNTQIANLMSARSNLDRSIFYKLSNFSTISIPAVTNMTDATMVTIGKTYRQWGLGNITSRVRLGPLQVKAVPASLSTAVTATIASALLSAQQHNAMMNSRVAVTARAYGDAARSVDAFSSNFTKNLNDASSVSRTAITTNYAKIDSLLNTVVSFMNNATSRVMTWDSGAQAKLASLMGQLSTAVAHLKSKGTGAAGSSTNAVLDKVVASMASLGTLKNQMNQELMNRNLAQMNKTNALLNMLTRNGLNFNTLMMSIKSLIESLSYSSTAAETPTNALLSIPTRMSDSAQAVRSMSAEMSRNYTRSKGDANAILASYRSKLNDFWASQLSSGPVVDLKDLINSRISWASDNMTASSQTFHESLKQMSLTEGAATNLVMNTKATLPNVEGPASSLVPTLLMQISARASDVANQITRSISDMRADGDTAWRWIRSEIDNMIASYVNDIKTAGTGSGQSYTNETIVIKKQLNGYADDANAVIRTGVHDVIDPILAYLKSYNSSVIAARQSQALADNLKAMNATLTDYDDVVNRIQATELRAAVSSGLGIIPTLTGPLNKARDFGRRNVRAAALIATANATLGSLVSQVFDTKTALTASDMSGNNLLSLMLLASSMDDIIAQESLILGNAVTSAASADSTAITNATTLLASNLTAISNSIPTRLDALNQTYWAKFKTNATALVDEVYKGALRAADYLNNRPVTPQTTFQDRVKTQLLDPLLAQLREAVYAYQLRDKSLNKLMEGADSTAASASGIPKALNSSTSSAEKMLALVKNFTASSNGATQGVITGALDKFSGQMKGLQNQSSWGLGSLSSSAADALEDALGSISSVENTKDLVRLTANAEMRERQNSVETVFNSLVSAQVGVNGALSSVMNDVLSQSSTREAQMAAGAAAMTVQQLALKIGQELAFANVTNIELLKKLSYVLIKLSSRRESATAELKNTLSDTDTLYRRARLGFESAIHNGHMGHMSELAAAEKEILAQQAAFDKEEDIFWNDVKIVGPSVAAALAQTAPDKQSPNTAASQLTTAVANVERMLEKAASINPRN